MYKIEFLAAKNQEKTVKVNDILLHSFYSPTKEAQKFVQSQEISYNFNKIFVLEPGLGYCIPFLKQQFPKKEIYVIKFINEIPLLESDCKIINFFDFNTTSDFENFFYNNFTEIDLLSAAFISWYASEKIFYEIYTCVWQSIKTVLDRSKSVLITRGYFEKKWLKNSCNNLKYINSVIKVTKKTDLPVLITASGPSLKKLIPFLKQNQNNFFIICVSSAITPLFYNNIVPDLCISTDGGFWAGEHLNFYDNKRTSTPLAISLESFCKKNILMNSCILPLTYNDGLSHELEIFTSISFFNAERNGTVSGTALKLALNISTNNIYLCGLDLHNTKGFQHLKPNRIEITKLINSNKINSLQKNLIGSEFNSGSLKTYENWFQMQSNSKKNIFRIIDEPKNSLNKIKDISINDFINFEINEKAVSNKNIFSEIIKINKNDKEKYLRKIIDFINSNYKTEKWISNIFPLDYVSLLHCKNSDEKDKILEKINNKNRKLVDNLNKILKFSEN